MARLVADNFSNGRSRVIVGSEEPGKFGYAAPTRMTLSSRKLRSLGWSPVSDLRDCYGRTIAFLEESGAGAGADA